MLIAIDPGPVESAYVILDKNLKPEFFGKVKNEFLLVILWEYRDTPLAIEMIASYGMATGATVYETCVWIGRFIQVAPKRKFTKIYRKEVKINLCNSMKAKDGNIRQALIDRFGVVGTKLDKGFFYGFKADIWQAYAVGITYYDMYLKGKGDK